jgi:7,8-dihydropterin-6-yl-methyl-4-(beta-D-ribofuranosyl)aminobenzene 5'-phosphate synthase
LAVFILLLAHTAVAGTPNRVTILYDSFGKSPTLTINWGFAALVEYGGKRILFDTGNNAQIFEHNVKAAGVDLQDLILWLYPTATVTIWADSALLLKVNLSVKIYAPKERFGVYGDDQPSSTVSQGSVPARGTAVLQRRPPKSCTWALQPSAHFQLIDKTIEMCPGMYLIALVSDKPGTLELRELQPSAHLTASSAVAGCSHPGVERIMQEASAIDPHIVSCSAGSIRSRHRS